jgi:hypothetical protein
MDKTTKSIRVDKMTKSIRLDKMTKENLKLGKKLKSTKDKKKGGIMLSLSSLSISLSPVQYCQLTMGLCCQEKIGCNVQVSEGFKDGPGKGHLIFGYIFCL